MEFSAAIPHDCRQTVTGKDNIGGKCPVFVSDTIAHSNTKGSVKTIHGFSLAQRTRLASHHCVRANSLTAKIRWNRDNLRDQRTVWLKHWLHEGGSATPFIFHRPKGVRQHHIETNYYAHVKDVMPTCLEIAGASYPLDHRGYPVQRLDGQSLMPNLRGQVSENPETLYLEHEGNRAVRRGKWKLVSYYSEPRGFTSGPIGKGDRTGPWELYDLEADRVELNDLSDKEVRIKEELIEAYGAFAERTGVSDWNEIQRDIEKFYAE